MMLGPALKAFLAKYGARIPGLALKGAIGGAAAVPVGYGVKSLLGDPEQEELKKILKEVRKVKSQQLKQIKGEE
jgi:hypothetical protein